MILTFEVDRDLGQKMEAVAKLRGCSLAQALRHACENEITGWEDTAQFNAALALVKALCIDPRKPLSPSSRLDPVPYE